MVRIFKYLEEADFFVIDPTYKIIADELGLTEWNEVVWIGRYFALDNDYGEHWFDNWELRQKLEKEIKKLGIDEAEVFVIDPDRFENGKDGPCHTYEERKRFWTDVIKSLKLSFETLICEARKFNEQKKSHDEETYIENLEEHINQIKIKYFSN
jgi:alpha-galactosidase/6-phospho-beta-glucosidase family protein